METSSRLWRWQCLTAATLLVGYSGYYICRSNLSVAAPALLTDGTLGLDRSAIGSIASMGIVAYALGKSITGIAGDFLGGRWLFLGGMGLAVVATIGFSASSSVPMLLACWIVNRFVQSAGWGGLTKTAAHWFPANRYGAVMSFLSLSFLFGDAAGRFLLGQLMLGGMGWRSVFVAAAAALAVIAFASAAVLRDSPADVGLPVPDVSRDNLFGAAGDASRPQGLRDLLTPYVSSLSFWLVCGLSLGMTLVREAFNTWIPAYLVDAHRLLPADAARASAIFPLIGGVSCLVVGVVADRLGSRHRVTIIAPAMALCAAALGLLAIGTIRHDLQLSLAAIGATALCLLGPYTLLAGAIAMDMGGRKGSATAAGLIDTAGYAGGTLSGYAVGRLAEAGGWAAVFGVLAAVAGGVALVAGFYWATLRHRPWVPMANQGVS